MAVKFSDQRWAELQEILTHYPNCEAALLPALWLAQYEFGTLTPEVLEYVATLLDISPAKVYGVCSFYTMLHTRPVGKYHIQVCRTLSCALVGSENILHHLQKKLGIAEGQMTPDGKFSLATVECLASCGSGPMMQVGETYYENLTLQKIDELLAKEFV